MADRGLTPDHITPSGLCAATAGDQAWVVLDGKPGHGLGAAVAYATSRHAASVDVVAERGTGTLARRAEAFRLPITVWHLDRRHLIPAVAEPLPTPPPARAEHLALIDDIVAGGAEPVVEHGVVAGEVHGLEVCRVVDDPLSGEVRLEVGVGAHDRETFQMLHGDRPTVEALADVVQAVATHRRPGAEPHPLNLLATERALRSAVAESPDLIGATAVVPAEPPVARASLKDATPCVAIATVGGQPMVAVFSVGVDLDLIPFATDARLALGAPQAMVPEAMIPEAMIVVPQRDALAVQQRINEALIRPMRIAST